MADGRQLAAIVPRDELTAFESSGQFDEKWYVAQYPDVKMLGMSPAEHFLWIGKRLGRKPNPSFSDDVRQEARDQIIKTVDGRYAKTPFLCLFSHYDLYGHIDDYVVTYLKSLADCGFCTVFVTTCEKITKRELDKIEAIVHKIIVKKNIGRDFGAWFTGIVDSWSFNSYTKVLLANDSVYGPLFDLNSVLEDMSERSFDMWGITDSYEVDYHIQSYFVVFEERVVNSAFFTNFWGAYTFEVDKRKVIDNFEVGLTALARRSGYRVGALCNYYDVRRQALRLIDQPPGTGNGPRQSRSTPVNPSHFFWRALIQRCHCPFLKIELVRDNPSGIDDVSLWEETIKDHAEMDVGLIKKHLKRMKAET